MGAAFELASAARAARMRTHRRARRALVGCAASAGRRAAQRHRGARRVPHVLNVSFEGVEGESLLAAVRPHLAVSTGSACTSATQEPSYVLRALGRDDRLAESSLRFSLGRFTSEADIDTAAADRDGRGRAAAPDCRPPGRRPRDRAAGSPPVKLQRAHPALLRAPGAHRHPGGPRLLPRCGRKPHRRAPGCNSTSGWSAATAVRRVREARFLAFGCPHVIAAASLGRGAGRGGHPRRSPLAAKRPHLARAA